jgi:hypothetical protein
MGTKSVSFVDFAYFIIETIQRSLNGAVAGMAVKVHVL